MTLIRCTSRPDAVVLVHVVGTYLGISRQQQHTHGTNLGNIAQGQPKKLMSFSRVTEKVRCSKMERKIDMKSWMDFHTNTD